ncbi:MAG: LysM peptidoglycan-binding domain-containing protein [Candidatus Omnitrophica bacterium]|nr:LysM peptidoglycan-binding domain-containing protein [Candidatus Omnitrophota bacterium]
MYIYRKILIPLLSVFFILFVTSCATAPPKVIEPTIENIYLLPQAPLIRQNIYHEVAPGETLWRLSKMYDISIEEIMRANNLPSSTLEKGQSLIIPNAAPLRPIISLYPSNKWRYIIIHHSATDIGSSYSIDGLHKERGFERGVGYHFIIDNGTRGKGDGQIEATPRWIKQQDGAHCKAGGMNHKGIGICLVGDISKEDVSERQMDSLVHLTRELKRYYKIPLSNIIGHGQVYGASTECPGTRFPWYEFKRKLSAE